MDFQDMIGTYDIDIIQLVKTIIFADNPSVIVLKDCDSKIIYVNKRFYRKHKEYSQNPESVIGKTDFDLFPNSIEHAKQARADEISVMQTGQSIDIYEIEGKDECGHMTIAHTRKYPMYNSVSECIGVFVITEDVSNDIEALKENQEKNYILTKLNKELTQENTTDTLSGLYNRRFIRVQLDSLYQEYLDRKIPFSIILLDLDDFKCINDRYGHAIGDEVIRFVGKQLLNVKRNLYSTIEPCRFGGDEFLIILPMYQKEGAIKIAYDIKENFEREVLECDCFHEKISMSIGVATIEHENVHELINECDKKLYEAKEKGKNKIVY